MYLLFNLVKESNYFWNFAFVLSTVRFHFKMHQHFVIVFSRIIFTVVIIYEIAKTTYIKLIKPLQVYPSRILLYNMYVCMLYILSTNSF